MNTMLKWCAALTVLGVSLAALPAQAQAVRDAGSKATGTYLHYGHRHGRTYYYNCQPTQAAPQQTPAPTAQPAPQTAQKQPQGETVRRFSYEPAPATTSGRTYYYGRSYNYSQPPYMRADSKALGRFGP